MQLDKTLKGVDSIAIYHCSIKMVQRSKGKSAVAAAAYRSGTKLINDWDGMTHDYTRKGGIIHSEILLPTHAPPEFQDRSTLWNSVEQIEKSSNSQLAREIEVALPVELSRERQLALVRSYIQDNFVSAGMCADFALHDKGDGNPHAHILLTVRPLTETGAWGAKCRKVYDLDQRGQRIPDGKGGWKNHREDTTDWNDRGKSEQWRKALADYVNNALEAAGRPERIDHRSYRRQGVEKVPSIHMGVAATRMERRGILTDKGNVNRQIAADNRLLKEIKARITRLYNWSKEQAAQSQRGQPTIAQLWEMQQQMTQPTSRSGKVKNLQAQAALFNFLSENGITTMQQLHEKISAMNKDYYDLRGKIVTAERRITKLEEQLTMWNQYERYKAVHRQYASLKPSKCTAFEENHHAELALFEAAARYLEKLKSAGEPITPKKWQAEVDALTAQKDSQYRDMRAMREEIKSVERLRKTAEQIAKSEQSQEHELEH